MEVSGKRYRRKLWPGFIFCSLLVLLFTTKAVAQPSKTYTVKNGRMYVQLTKDITAASLDSFIADFDLGDLGLPGFMKTGKADTLLKLGWKIETNNETGFVISKPFEPFKGLADLDKIFSKEGFEPLFPSVNNGIVFGENRFRNKAPFLIKDSIVRFFLRNQKNAKTVMLAGSFNKWVPDQIAMQKTDSGWISDVKIGVGKWWYKFIVDGNWITDPDNLQAENDGVGNTNSVFYRTNVVFALPGFENAKKVFLAGSFNDWDPAKLSMKKTATGWELPLYLAEGTYTYKFVVDGNWYADEANPEKMPDGNGGYNSVIRLGKPYVFRLEGYNNAKEVIVVGSFNQWREFELPMNKTSDGWELPYVLGAGNYEYKFKVDGNWIADPANTMSSASSGNSYLIISPNYSFRLKGFKDAKQVFLAGDFNNWDPVAYAMKKEGDDWVLPVHLSVGKHLYKFFVDDKWIIDPGNKLWEQNEYGTGNSVIWIEQ